MTFEDIAQNTGAQICAALPGESWGEPFAGFIRPLRYKNKMYLT